MSTRANAESAPPVAVGGVFQSLNGLRGLSALLVFGFHYTTIAVTVGDDGGLDYGRAMRPRWLDISGNLAVSIFFVLSGFLLTWSFLGKNKKKGRWSDFYVARFARLYPVYLLTLVLYVVVRTALGEKFPIRELFVFVTLTQSWIPDQSFYHGINPVAWSLSVEVFCYAVFPLVLLGVRAISSSRRAVATVITLIVAAFVLPLYVSHYFDLRIPSHEIFSTDRYGGPVPYWFTMAFPPYRLIEFACGSVVCWSLMRGWLRFRVTFHAMFAIAVAGYAVATFAPHLFQRSALCLPIVLVLLVGALMDDESGRKNFLQTSVMDFFGRISYAMYALQFLVVVPIKAFIVPVLWSGDGVYGVAVDAAVLVVTFAVLVLASYLLYSTVEIKAYKAIIRKWGSRVA